MWRAVLSAVLESRPLHQELEDTLTLLSTITKKDFYKPYLFQHVCDRKQNFNDPVGCSLLLLQIKPLCRSTRESREELR